MNRMTIAAGAGAVLAMLAGCGPKLAQVPYGSEEARWQKTLRDNYSGYEAPRTAPPAIRDNVSERLLEEEQMRKNAQDPGSAAPAANDPAVADDPARMVDNAAERPAVREPEPLPPAGAKAPDAKAPDAKAAGEYEVKPGDTLGGIARSVYGDARRSDVIVRANPALKDPNFLKPGMKLVIPKI